MKKQFEHFKEKDCLFVRYGCVSIGFGVPSNGDVFVLGVVRSSWFGGVTDAGQN